MKAVTDQQAKKIKISSWIIKVFEVLTVLAMLSIISGTGAVGLASVIVGIYKVWIWIHMFLWIIIAIAGYAIEKSLTNPQSKLNIDYDTVLDAPDFSFKGIKYIIADIISWAIIVTAFFCHYYVIVVLGIICETCYLYVKRNAPRIKQLIRERVKFEEIKQRQDQSFN